MSVLFDPEVLYVVGGALAALSVGSVVRLLVLRRVEDEELADRRRKSLKSWWGVALLVGGAALLGRTAAVLLFLAASALAFREFLRLTVRGRSRGPLLVEGLLLIGTHYLLLWLGLRGGMTVFLPVAGLVWASGRLSFAAKGSGFQVIAGDLVWGLLLTGYGVSHAVWFFAVPEIGNPVAGPAGWFLYLVLLAEMNDIFQALVGRSFGSRRISPRLSPHKTWEGFAGGLATTVLLAVLLAPLLTPLDVVRAALAGLLVAPAGLAGDLTISALKRRVGAKDSGTMLPGQGGILDRVDGLLLSAPLFFYFLVLFS